MLGSYEKDFEIQNILSLFYGPNLLFELNKVLEQNKLLLNEHDIKIENNISDDVIVQADRLRLEELLNNLLVN